MQTTKDISINSLSSKLRSKLVKKTPNILKTPTVRSSSTAYLADDSSKRSLRGTTPKSSDSLPFMKFLFPDSNDDVEVLVFDQSNYPDAATGDDPLRAIVNSDEADMKEIVVEENQIFQLKNTAQGYVNLPIRFDENGAKEKRISKVDERLRSISGVDKRSRSARKVDDRLRSVRNGSKRTTPTPPLVEDPVSVSIDIEENGRNTVEEDPTPDRSNSPITQLSICRTCLKPVTPYNCHKLYDVDDNLAAASELRQKLIEVADFIDMHASLDPVLCAGCYEVIDAAYAFRNRVRAVEEQIDKKRKGVITVDLKEVVENITREKLKAANSKKKDELSISSLFPSISEETEELYLEKYLEKRKRIIDRYVSSLKDDNSIRKIKSAKITTINQQKVSATTIDSDIPNTSLPTACEDDRPSLSLLQDILSAQSNDGNALIEIINEDEEWEETTPDLELSIPAIEDAVTISDFPVPNVEAAIPVLDSSIYSSSNLECLIEVVDSDAPIPEYSRLMNPSTEYSEAPASESSAPVVDLSLPITDNEMVLDLNAIGLGEVDTAVPVSVTEDTSNKIDTKAQKDGPLRDSKWRERNRAASLEAFLAQRHENCSMLPLPAQLLKANVKAEKGTEVSGEATKMMDNLDGDRKKRSMEAYKYLFNLNVHKKKKPLVPKTFDLFDAEHDKYFRDLEGEAGCFMVRKWKRFSQHLPDFGEPPYVCDICGRYFTKRLKFRQHLDHHMGRDYTICSYCGLKVSMVRLHEHVMTRHTAPRFECQDCGRKFHLKSLLTSHVTLIHKNPSRRYQCQVCGVMLKKNSLLVHMKKHDNTQKHTCELCRKVFPNQVSWYAHWKRHFMTKVYICNICSKPIKSQANLKKHMNAFHEGGETKSCNICGKALSKRQSLLRHLRIQHGSKPHIVRRKPGRKKTRPILDEEQEIAQAPELIPDSAVQETATVMNAQGETVLVMEAQEETATIFEAQETTIAMGAQEEMATIIEAQEETTIAMGAQEEMAKVIEAQEETTIAMEAQEEMATVIEAQEETTIAMGAQEEVATVIEAQEETTAAMEGQEETATIMLAQEETATVMEAQEALIYESIMDAPTGVEVVEIPYNPVDGMFLY